MILFDYFYFIIRLPHYHQYNFLTVQTPPNCRCSNPATDNHYNKPSRFFTWKIRVRFLQIILAVQYAEPSETMSRWWLEVILTVGCQDVKYKHHYDNPGQYGHTNILKMETFQ